MNEITVETRFNKDLIAQEVCTEIDGVRNRIFGQVLRMQEEGLRQALIEMGWTPPPEITVQHLPADDSEGGLA